MTEGKPNIKLSFTYTEGEVRRGYRFSKIARKRIIIIILLLFILAIIFALIERFDTSLNVHVKTAFGIGSKVLLFTSSFYTALILIYWMLPILLARKTQIYKGEFQLDVSEDRIDVVQIYEPATKDTPEVKAERYFKWSDYKWKNENDEFIFLLGKRNRSFIPKRAFNSDEEYSRFKELLEEKTHIKERTFKTINAKLQRIELPRH